MSRISRHPSAQAAPSQTLSIDELLVSGVEIIGPAERFEASLRGELTRLFSQPNPTVASQTGTLDLARRQITLRGGSRLSADAAGVVIARALYDSLRGDPR